MEYRILGPLEARGESGPVALGGIKPRTVLAVLLLHPNESVHSERLALALWGEDAPASAAKTVQVYVSRLRKALGDADALMTTSAGYCLRVGEDELDAERFAQLAEDGRRALDAGQAVQAAALLREALGLWRGPPLADLAFEAFAQAEIARMEEQRLVALEARVEADLVAGGHAELVAELQHLVSAHPSRERLIGQLMLALYRSGRQVDALEAYRSARRALIDENGVEPGPELRRIEEAILRHDPSLGSPVDEPARREAARRVSEAAGRTAAGRAELRSLESELSGSIADYQARSERVPADAAPIVCPFKGLASFDVADAPYFFGRERLVAELVARLVGAPLLGIVGPSGSGKSSVLRAGLLPALAGGVLPGSENWPQTIIRPGERPLHELAGDDRRRVVAVDQFEEVFTARPDEQERAEFLDELARIAGGAAIVVLAVRADYYGRCAAYPQLARLLAANHVLVGPMRRDELRRAIEGPAQRAALQVDPALADALVADVEEQLGGLPLLSAALVELWQRRDGRRLRYEAYERTGGARGAVARLAEDAFTQLDARQQAVARGLLMRLVGLRPDGTAERRRVPLTELQGQDVAHVLALFTDRRLLTASATTAEVAHEALLDEWPRLCGWIEEDRDALRAQRNLAAAAQEWQRVGHDRGALYRGVRLDEALALRDLDELEGDFLAASEASSTRERTTRRRRIALLATAVATLSAALVAIVVTLLFADRERDTAASRDLATRSSSLLSTDPGLALAIALEARRRSDTEQARIAIRQAALAHRATHVIAAHDGRAFDVSPSPDGRLAATAGGDRTVRIWSLASGRRVGEVGGYRDEVRAVSFGPDGRRIATAAHDGEIAVAPVHGGARHVLARLPGDFATSIDFGADGRTLSIGTYGGRVALVAVRDGALRDLRPGPGPPVFAARFDRATRRVVAAGYDGSVELFGVAGGRPLRLAPPGGAPVLTASFSPDGARVATGDVSGSLRLFNSRRGGEIKRLKLGDQPLASVRFSGDGRRIAIGSFGGVIEVADARGNGVLAELRGHDGPARADFAAHGDGLVSAGEEDGTLRTWLPPAAAFLPLKGAEPVFSRDGRIVVSGSDTGPVHVWTPATGEQRELPGHDEHSVARLSPDGRRIVSASFDGSVRLWDVATGRSRVVPSPPGEKYAAAIDSGGGRVALGGAAPLVIQALDGTARVRLQGHRGYVNALAFSPDSRHLLTGSDDATARVWNARTGALERTLRGHTGVVRGVAYSDDGRSIATSGSDGTVRIWPADGGDAVTLVGHEGAVNTVSFNRRGDRVVSAGDDGTIRVWDAAGGDALVVLGRHEGIAAGADFGPDGHAVVSAGGDGMRVIACEVCGSMKDVLRVAGTRAPHRLTAAERQRLLSEK